MCFVLLALQQHTEYPFILAANRDEFYDRPAMAMHEWDDAPGVIAGRDLQSMGTWLAVNQYDGRFAIVTNVRDGTPQTAERSRGMLIHDLVNSTVAMRECIQNLQSEQHRYAGFNVLAGYLDGEVYYFSNRNVTGVSQLETGLHALSNAALNTPWPKVVRGKQRLSTLLEQPSVNTSDLFAILRDDEIAPDEQLPETGVGLDKERWLSPLFIHNPEFGYGTRCSTLILMDAKGKVRLLERSFAENGVLGEVEFEFDGL